MRAQADSRDWRNPLSQNLTVLPAPPFGGAGIEQSEMTERVSPPREAGAAFLAPGQIAKIDFRGTGRFCVDLHFGVC